MHCAPSCRHLQAPAAWKPSLHNPEAAAVPAFSPVPSALNLRAEQKARPAGFPETESLPTFVLPPAGKKAFFPDIPQGVSGMLRFSALHPAGQALQKMSAAAVPPGSGI